MATNATVRRVGVQARLSLLLLLLLALGGLSIASGPASVAAQTDAVFSEMQASSEFGTSLTFSTTITSATPIEEVELYWHASGDLELSAAYPEFAAGNELVINHDVDLSFIYLPPGIDIVYFWRVIDSDGNATDSSEQILFYMDDGPDWKSITNGLVTVWWYSGNQEFADDILGTANRTIETLAKRFEITADEPIRLVIYGNDKDFMAALPPNSADWIGGQAHPSLNLIVAQVRPGTGVGREIRRMVPHEVSHLIVHQATENPWNPPLSTLSKRVLTAPNHSRLIQVVSRLERPYVRCWIRGLVVRRRSVALGI